LGVGRAKAGRVTYIPPDMPVERKAPETPLIDVMQGDARREIKVHDHGLVALVDVMPRLVPEGKTADFAIVQAARVSYDPVPAAAPAHDAAGDGGVQVSPRDADLHCQAVDPAPDGERE
jgi:hypothetical protein